MLDILGLIGRNSPLFVSDINKNSEHLSREVSKGRFLVLGGAGAIGQAVTKEIFKRNPKVLHVVDISYFIYILNFSSLGRLGIQSFYDNVYKL